MSLEKNAAKGLLNSQVLWLLTNNYWISLQCKDIIDCKLLPSSYSSESEAYRIMYKQS